MQMECVQKDNVLENPPVSDQHTVSLPNDFGGLISNSSSQWLRLKGIPLWATRPQGAVILRREIVLSGLCKT